MDPLSFPLPEARDLFAAQTRQLLDAVHSLSELDLLTPSLCTGWSRLELVEHLRIGLDEMAAAACTTTDTAPDHDAASYWGSFARTEDEDPVPGIMWLRRTASASARPAGAVERLAEAAERMTPEAIGEHLYTKGQPDPDLVIRTSGEQRLSGFLLWQSEKSEYYFCEAYWPDFRRVDFLRALRAYAERERRYGR